MKYPFKFTSGGVSIIYTAEKRPHDSRFIRVSWGDLATGDYRSTSYSVEAVEDKISNGVWQVVPEPIETEEEQPETYSVDALMAVVPKDMSIIINSKGLRLTFIDVNTGFNIDVRVKNGESLTEVIKAAKYFNSALEAHKSE